MLSASGLSASIDHVGISVPDLESAVAWYADALGVDPLPILEVADGLRACVLHDPLRDMRIELLHARDSVAGEPRATPAEAVARWGIGHLCLRVRDVEDALGHLVALGATTVLSPRASPRGGAVMAFAADPWANLIELISRD